VGGKGGGAEAGPAGEVPCDLATVTPANIHSSILTVVMVARSQGPPCYMQVLRVPPPLLPNPLCALLSFSPGGGGLDLGGFKEFTTCAPHPPPILTSVWQVFPPPLSPSPFTSLPPALL